MKKSLLLALLFMGISVLSVNAQSSSIVKEDCNPKICCPATPKCCKTTKGNFGSSESNTKDNEASTNTTREKKATKSAVAIIETKKTSYEN